jgi:hypothetical protein
VAGHFPFTGASLVELFENIAHADFRMPEFMSPELQTLLRGLLCVRERRMCMDDIKRCACVPSLLFSCSVLDALRAMYVSTRVVRALSDARVFAACRWMQLPAERIVFPIQRRTSFDRSMQDRYTSLSKLMIFFLRASCLFAALFSHLAFLVFLLA